MELSELETIYRQNNKSIYKFFYYKTHSQELAEDLCSDTFLNFVESMKDSTEIADPTKYLYGIGKNVFMSYLRGKYNTPLIDYVDLDFETYLPQFVEETENRPTIEEKARPYIQLLPEKQKQIAKLRFLEKNTLSEICEIVGKDMNYVKTTQKRALKSLRKLIERTP